MLNIHELERRWLRYKIKSFMPAAAAGVISILLVSIIIFWPIFPPRQSIQEPDTTIQPPVISAETAKAFPASVSPEKTIQTKIQEQPITAEPEIKEQAAALQSKPAMVHKEPSVVLEPSMHFLNTIEEDIVLVYKEDTTAHVPAKLAKTKIVTPEKPVSAPQSTPAKKETVTMETSTEKAQTAPAEPAEKKSQITIISKEDIDDLKDVISRFRKNKNPALSLFVAKRYYDIQQYEKAYNYALMTNEINDNIEDSWLIFAKSLVKLGQKEKATNTLKSYIKHSDSTKAKMLLEDIIQGSFK